jgi:hypothetical protein
MSEYRLWCLDTRGRILHPHDLEAGDDQTALATANQREHPEHDCELWQGQRRVAKIAVSADRTVYTINRATGVATAVSGALDIDGSVFGFDFNPTIDRVRIVSNTDKNYVFNPNDGSLTGPPTTTTLAALSKQISMLLTNDA